MAQEEFISLILMCFVYKSLNFQNLKLNQSHQRRLKLVNLLLRILWMMVLLSKWVSLHIINFLCHTKVKQSHHLIIICTISNNAFEIYRIVLAHCCPRKCKTRRQFLWIMRGSHLLTQNVPRNTTARKNKQWLHFVTLTDWQLLCNSNWSQQFFISVPFWLFIPFYGTTTKLWTNLKGLTVTHVTLNVAYRRLDSLGPTTLTEIAEC